MFKTSSSDVEGFFDLKPVFNITITGPDGVVLQLSNNTTFLPFLNHVIYYQDRTVSWT